MGDAFAFRQEDAFKLLAVQAHMGATNVDFQMEQYVWKRKSDGVHIINIKKTWEKLILAARAIAAVEDPKDVCVISSRIYGQRAVLKFAAHVGATPIVGRFTPGTFTNQIQKAFREPRLLVVTDPRIDHQAITEASYVNIPVICLANTDSPLAFCDIAIPCNTKGPRSVGLMWWMLAREVLCMRGKINRQTGFELEGKEIMPDLYFYRDPEDIEKEEQEGAVEAQPEDSKWGAPEAPVFGSAQPISGGEDMTGFGGPGELQVPTITDWAAETQQWTSQQKPSDPVASQWGGGGSDWA